MSPLTEPTRLVLRKGWQPMDSDAATYIAAVEAADGQALEEKTKIAIDNFVLGCKADGIWNAIKASCILAGARTLAGALVPLVGAAPTNFNFVTSDYNRKTGLVGNGSSKYLNSNTPHNIAPQNNAHISIYASTKASNLTNNFYLSALGGSSSLMGVDRNDSPVDVWYIHDTGSAVPRFTDAGSGFKGLSRNNANNYSRRTQGATTSVSRTASATAPTGAGNYIIFAYVNGSLPTDARLAFYSIGEALNLALLDTRVTALINAIGAAF